MKKLNRNTSMAIGFPAVFAVALVLAVVRCSSDNSADNYQQIERLGRPAINEGLVITDAYLTAFNSIPPTADLSAGAKAVTDEAQVVLGKLHDFGAVTLGLGQSTVPTVAKVVGQFLPDVMRIDTTLSNTGLGNSAYNHFSATKTIPIGGRKIEDDVIDITLSYLIAGDPTGATVKDEVSYCGGGGADANVQGHTKLLGMTGCGNGSAATFPFLAAPN